jgi:hypothetical protein
MPSHDQKFETWLSTKCFPISGRTLFLGRFPGLAFVLVARAVDEDEYLTLAEL